MLSRWICCRTWGLALTALSVALAGCSKEKLSEPDAEPTADVAKPAESEAEIQAQVEAKLAKADLFDGTTDKTVTRCARDGIEDRLDPGCVDMFQKAPAHNYEIMKLAMTEMPGHIAKGGTSSQSAVCKGAVGRRGWLGEAADRADFRL